MLRMRENNSAAVKISLKSEIQTVNGTRFWGVRRVAFRGETVGFTFATKAPGGTRWVFVSDDSRAKHIHATFNRQSDLKTAIVRHFS